ncbi:hypothetical protein [Amycolatopsis sp. H20-H5]|uniref:hypothetical protein n=1 Tax=Amycolatopsis sp. H20-H5 TaxID=3046309 RepID=UPI002DB86C02|nr:hypothetical protein [Amycolatopsis sp. H20-H5]MEC3975307.1 hypothetical protein [Amycolatopsis sp. H20-H5]
MTRWIRTALTCTAVTIGLAFFTPAASAEEPQVPAVANSGTLTWQLDPIHLDVAAHPECSDWPSGATCNVLG